MFDQHSFHEWLIYYSYVNRNLLTLTHILQTRVVLNDGHKAFLFPAKPSLGVHIHQERPPHHPQCQGQSAPGTAFPGWMHPRGFHGPGLLSAEQYCHLPLWEKAVAIRGRDFSGCSSDYSSWEVVGGGKEESYNLRITLLASKEGGKNVDLYG